MVNAIAFGLLCVVLIIAAVTDMRTGKIFNWLTYPAMLAGLALWTCAGLLHLPNAPVDALAGLSESFLALLAGLIPFMIIFAIGGLGGGDAKLMAAIGAITARWECVLDASVYAFLIAGLMALVVILRKRIALRTLQRIFGAMLTAFAKVKPEFPADSPRIAFGLAACLGGLLAGADRLLGLNLPWSNW